MKDNVLKKMVLPSEYTFGKEFEVTGGMTSDDMQKIVENLVEKQILRVGWEVHYDSSVVDENGLGYEIVSPPLHDDQTTYKEFIIILEIIINSGGYVSDINSSHTHFGLQCLGNNVDVLKRFLKLYFVFEPDLIKFSIGDLDHVRESIYKYAIPIQKRICNVIEGEYENISEFMMSLEACVGANATYYGPYRYYALNIQRIVRAISNIPASLCKTETLERLFEGQEIIGKDGKQLTPTIEFRYPGSTFNIEDLMFEIRLEGNMMKAAHDESIDEILDELYKKAKKRKASVLDKILPSEMENYIGMTEEEILKEKFIKSIYGNGIFDTESTKQLLALTLSRLNTDEIERKVNERSYRYNSQNHSKGLSLAA